MKVDIKSKWPVLALSVLGMASSVSAARNDDRCAPEPPTEVPRVFGRNSAKVSENKIIVQVFF